MKTPSTNYLNNLNLNYVVIYFPKQIVMLQSGVNGSINQTLLPVLSPETPQVTATKPAPPPRDHLKIEKDGRLVNMAPAPQVPARLPNNNVSSNTTSPPTATPTPTGVVEPTREQLDSIKKYQVGIKLCRIF